MSGRASRVLRWLGGGLVSLVLILSATAWILLSTQPGLRVAWMLVAPRLPENVRVTEVGGRLSGPLRVTGVHFESEAAVVDVSTIEVDWDLLPLMRRRLEVQALEIGDVAVTLAEGAPEEAPTEEAVLPTVTLPIDLSVTRATLRAVQVLRAEDTARIVVDSVAVRDLSFRHELEFGELVAGAPLGRLRASGRLMPRGSYPFELETSVEINDTNVGLIVGKLVSHGDLEGLQFAAEVSQPFGATATGRLADVLTRPAVEARLSLEEADLRALAPDAPEGRAGGVVDVAGVLDSIDAAANASVVTPLTGPVELEASLGLRGSTVHVERLSARLGRAFVTAAGTVALSEDGPDADVELTWSGARWPIQDEAVVWSDEGSARIRGVPTAYRIAAYAQLRSEAVPATRVRLRGAGSTEHLSMDELRIDALAGDLTARGRVAWVPEPRWDLELTGRELDARELPVDSGSLHGRVSFEGRTRGRMAPSLAEADLTLDTVRGTLNDAPLDASMSGSATLPLTDAGADWSGASLSVRWLGAAWGPNRAFASGRVDDSVDVQGRFVFADLSTVAPTLGGSIEGLSQFRGSRSLPEAEIDLEARGLVAGSTRIERAVVVGRVQTHAGGAVDVDVGASGVALGDRFVDSVRARVRGAPENHVLAAGARSGPIRLDLEASGGVVERAWAGVLTRLELDGTPLGDWRLSDAVSASASAEAAGLERGCWRSDPGVVCLEGTWTSGGPSAVSVSVADLAGSAFEELMPEGWSLAGVLQADVSAAVEADGTLVADAQADLGAGRIRYPTSSGPRELGYSSAGVEGTVGEGGARATFGATLVDEAARDVVVLAGDLALPDFTNVADSIGSSSIRGSLRADVDDFSPFESMMMGVTPTAGSLRADVDVSGSVERPELVGEARLRGGGADVPLLGLELREIELTARGRGLEGVTLEGSLRSGSGSLTLSGEVPNAPSSDQPARLRVQGTRVQAVALPEVEVWLSPDLEVVSSPERLGITGEIRVPTARVELSEIPATAVRPSRDVVFVDDSVGAPEAIQNLSLSVRLVLGDSVSFSGFGFSAQPTGSVLAADGPGGTTTGTGEIALNAGRYRAYGQDLTMERGRLLFAGGPIENPGLDIRATRTAQDGVVAGLQVGGTLSRPDVTLFSEPAMAESDALAYIILGRPLGTASSSEGNRVANAAASLGLREGNVLANRIGQRFGLAEMRVEAEGPLEEAALVAGKYLSPRLYVTYGVGLFEPISTFRLRYMLSSRLTLRAESGRAAGADLLYRIERGR